MPFLDLACRRSAPFALAFLLTTGPAAGQGREDYLTYAEAAYQRGLETVPLEVRQWRIGYEPSPFWGYGPPGEPVWFARLAAGLHGITQEDEYAIEAAKWLAGHHLFKDAFPDEVRARRPEYADGLPTLTDFFQLPFYCRAYLDIRGCDAVTDAQRQRIELSIAESADFVFDFPEWGPMNRAMLRAEGLVLAAQAVPAHPRAAQWEKLARILAYDSQGKWEEEDAQIYHPVWLNSLARYGEATRDRSLFFQPTTRYYFDYYLQLLSPAGMIPEFGDARWNENWAPYVASFEHGATLFARRDLKWAARRIFRDMVAKYGKEPSVRVGMQLLDAFRWAQDDIPPRPPTDGSREVLEDLVGKKIVFRSGWEPHDTYLMLNYRDEGDFARVPRDYLRHTIPVEEEKMHHGHSDENAICLLMDGGSVLLNEAGYRDALPSGPYGRFRADYFHNRLVTRKGKRGREQPLFEFLRDSGAHHPVRTEKIDFFDTEDVDVSRTRLVDERAGLQSDRVIVWVKEVRAFVVIDIVKVLETDFYTLATLWHTTTVNERGERYFDTAIDRLYNDEPTGNRALLIDFLQGGIRQAGAFPIVRQHQDEKAIHQALSSHYLAGQIETFVTVLTPHERGADVGPILSAVELLEVDDPRAGVGVKFTLHGNEHYVCVQTDLDRGILTENVRPRYTFASGAVTYGPIRTDAGFLYARRAGTELTYRATHMVGIDYRGESIFLSGENSFTLQPDDLETRYGRTKWRYWEDTVTVGAD